MMIIIDSKRRKRENILKEYSEAMIGDVTRLATGSLLRVGPLYHHGEILMPQALQHRYNYL